MTAFETTTTRLVQQELGACALIQDLLPLYIENEVTPASRNLIVEHLAHCERCAGFLAGARSTREQLHRESMLRQTSVAHDRAARQAISVGQRQVMAVVLGVFGVLCLVVVVGVITIGFVRSSPASAPSRCRPSTMWLCPWWIRGFRRRSCTGELWSRPACCSGTQRPTSSSSRTLGRCRRRSRRHNLHAKAVSLAGRIIDQAELDNYYHLSYYLNMLRQGFR